MNAIHLHCSTWPVCWGRRWPFHDQRQWWHWHSPPLLSPSDHQIDSLWYYQRETMQHSPIPVQRIHACINDTNFATFSNYSTHAAIHPCHSHRQNKVLHCDEQNNQAHWNMPPWNLVCGCRKYSNPIPILWAWNEWNLVYLLSLGASSQLRMVSILSSKGTVLHIKKQTMVA